MGEFQPFVLGAVLGALIWLRAAVRARVPLGIGAAILSGLAAVIGSGEYRASWAYLLLDAGEAALGVAVAFALAYGLRARAVGKRDAA